MTKVRNKYKWSDTIDKSQYVEDHTKTKHSIIQDYIRSYLKVVANPLTGHIKLTIVDGFCGGGLYRALNGEAHFGTPIIILNTLRDTIAEIVADRIANNIKREFSIECNIYFIDKDKEALEILKKVATLYSVMDPKLPLKVNLNFIHSEFATIYKDLLARIGKSKAIFVLDPFGYSEIPLNIIKEIMSDDSGKREAIWTFMIDAMLTFATNESQGLINAGYGDLLRLFDKNEKPTGFCVQKAIFETIKREIGVPFFTPFAIKQKVGWNYWLIHLAHHHRASEVMKDVEHRHADQREHYGLSGLNMMAKAGNGTYLFGEEDIKKGRTLLQTQIPELLSKSSHVEGISFSRFMKETYNETPLVSSAIKDILVNHDDIEIVTPTGGNRSSAQRIKTGDIIKLKRQKRFFFNN